MRSAKRPSDDAIVPTVPGAGHPRSEAELRAERATRRALRQFRRMHALPEIELTGLAAGLAAAVRRVMEQLMLGFATCGLALYPEIMWQSQDRHDHGETEPAPSAPTIPPSNG